MTSKAQKLLERMKQSKVGWRRQDLDKLYRGFGFVIQHGSNHDIVKHPQYPHLRTTLPRHSYLARGYVDYAIKLIDALIQLQMGTEDEQQPENDS
jgi:hypothetical protein